MAREKKSMIGFDPLAWLDDEAGDNTAADKKNLTQEKKKTAVKVKKTNEKKTAKKDAEKIITVMGHSLDETALLKGYGLAADVLDEVVADFYNELFTQHPEVKGLFENTTSASQANKLAAAIKLLADNLYNEDALNTTLTIMGERHQGYGVLPDHYPIVAELLVASFKKIIGRSWTKAVSAAWTELLVAAAEIMCAAYKDDIEEEVIVEKENTTQVNSSHTLHPRT